jgi:hypothetical protein
MAADTLFTIMYSNQRALPASLGIQLREMQTNGGIAPGLAVALTQANITSFTRKQLIDAAYWRLTQTPPVSGSYLL